MACAIEDAGFQIRDQIMWVYGSGFPKSLNISKAIDKAAGVEFNSKPASGVGFMNNNDDGYNTTLNQLVQVGESTPEAKEWDGWGTALKPAHEPIVLARKPLDGTVAKNVLTHGTGGINIDGCRVGEGTGESKTIQYPDIRGNNYNNASGTIEYTVTSQGRFPANFIHDGSEEVLELFPDTKGGTWNTTKGARHFNNDGEPTGYATSKSDSSTGSAARFFYCAKASKKDRNEGLDHLPEVMITGRDVGQDAMAVPHKTRSNLSANYHPTVKPTDLMRYLCRLITPPNGTVLDPFTGSGSTGKAAVLEGFSFIGVEQSEEYIAIAEARIQSAKEDK
jgi:site-specific DNA-methyltransferase (adenine-specific)